MEEQGLVNTTNRALHRLSISAEPQGPWGELYTTIRRRTAVSVSEREWRVV